MVVKEETRKGPWTEQEDLQLVFSVRLFGERHWDFIAQVSGLNRTGKSCRLRWVNYLHPGLKRGRMTPDEERLVLELHSRWGNRWSRIARRLPGRTDNEIKNYWRTHMRKRAQERKRNSSTPSTSSPSPSSPSSCLLNNDPPMTGPPLGNKHEPHGGSEGCSAWSGPAGEENYGKVVNAYPMEQIWDEIESSEMRAPTCYWECKDEAPCDLACAPMPSPPWEYSWDSLWKIDDEDYKMFLPPGDVCLASQQPATQS